MMDTIPGGGRWGVGTCLHAWRFGFWEDGDRNDIKGGEATES